MKHQQLRNYFKGVGVKQLSAVDTDPATSNQHEVGTTQKMRTELFGDDHQRQYDTVYVWLGEEQGGITEFDKATHYNARQNKPRAPEWRLYYSSNPVTEAMREGDTLFLAKDQRGRLWFIVTLKNSTAEKQLHWLFDLPAKGETFISRQFTASDPELDYSSRFILKELGVEIEEPDDEKLDSIIEQFGTTFPPTAKFSEIARGSLPKELAKDDPDAALVAWSEREEALFRRLEYLDISGTIMQGFITGNRADVDGFIEFSLGVQNRRKSRRGRSFEHHIAALLDSHGVSYTREAITEQNYKADFLFPSLDVYRKASVGDPRLVMLAAKSSCKERWRQVLREAEKVPHKHLVTLEPSITEAQTTQMDAENIQLVVPRDIQATYTSKQRRWLWSVQEFIDYVLERQN